MSDDPTEDVRRELVALINQRHRTREELEALLGISEIYDTKEMTEAFDVLGFAAPLVVVRRKSDGKKGSLFFQHMPRFYFLWEEYEP